MNGGEQAKRAVVAALSPRRGGADGLAAALGLAGAHAVSLTADGDIEPVDRAALERALFVPGGQLALDRAGWEARLSPEDAARRRRALGGLDWSGARVSVDYALTDGQGGTRAIRETVELVTRADNRLARRGVLIDRTSEESERARDAWRRLHDPVTALPNARDLEARAATLAALGGRAHMEANMLRLRLSNLDDLGATYGPDCADRLLRALARRLEDTVRAPDALARVGERDFAVCVLGTDPAALGQRLRERLADAPYSTPFGPLYLDLDIATVRLSPVPGAPRRALEDLGARLDGRPAPPHPVPQSDTDVLQALETDRISLAFQPIVSARTGAVHHHECLLRLRGHDGRTISAGAIVQQAERLGLVSQLDERALDLAAPYLASHPDLHLALNVSAGTLGDPAAAARYLGRLAGLGAAAARVTVEMTETLAVDDPAAAARFSSEVRALGCRFAVDDFGSGYTTFRNLMAVEADSLKIDGALIRGIATDPNKQTFMRMMVDLAQTFSVETVAEMVECEADAAVLRRLGADYLQGYHFGYPAPSPVWSRMSA